MRELKEPAHKARVTVVESVFHQLMDGDATAAPAKPYSYVLSTNEQPWVRRIRVEQDWMPLDVGWIVSCSMLCLQNEGGPRKPGKPTLDQQIEEARRIMEVGIKSDVTNQTLAFSALPPGQSLRFPPTVLDRLAIRCRHGETACLLTMFPGDVLAVPPEATSTTSTTSPQEA